MTHLSLVKSDLEQETDRSYVRQIEPIKEKYATKKQRWKIPAHNSGFDLYVRTFVDKLNSEDTDCSEEAIELNAEHYTTQGRANSIRGLRNKPLGLVSVFPVAFGSGAAAAWYQVYSGNSENLPFAIAATAITVLAFPVAVGLMRYINRWCMDDFMDRLQQRAAQVDFYKSTRYIE